MPKEIIFKQVYIPYFDWEDWKNGMWRRVSKEEEEILLLKAIEFISDTEKFRRAMMEVCFNWKNTMINSLTNPSINKKAFLGQCAVQFAIDCPESITRQAWKIISETKRNEADFVANQTISLWKKEYLNTLQNGNKDAM